MFVTILVDGVLTISEVAFKKVIAAIPLHCSLELKGIRDFFIESQIKPANMQNLRESPGYCQTRKSNVVITLSALKVFLRKKLNSFFAADTLGIALY